MCVRRIWCIGSLVFVIVLTMITISADYVSATVTNSLPARLSQPSTITLIPKLSVLPDSGNVGDLLTLVGSGFAPNEFMIFRVDGVVLFVYQTGWDGRMQVMSDQYGAFGNPTVALGSALTPSVRFTVPSLVGGPHTVSAEDESGNVAKTTLTVTAKIFVTPLIARVGTQIRAYGTGMRFEVPLKITLDKFTLSEASLVTDAGGFFDTKIEVPDTHKGIYTITVDDGLYKTEFSFIVQGEPPVTPVLILPKSGYISKQPAGFKWGAVIDSSGVTYELQVSANPEFGITLLDKNALDDPEYLLTETEKLKVTANGNLFYWRVRAIDGTGIGGEWSNVRTYNVDPAWRLRATYIGCVLSAGLVLALVIWFKRKKAK